jgi:hypothetical protein
MNNLRRIRTKIQEEDNKIAINISNVSFYMIWYCRDGPKLVDQNSISGLVEASVDEFTLYGQQNTH